MVKLRICKNGVCALLLILIMLIGTATIGYSAQGKFDVSYISNGTEESVQYELSVKVVGNGTLYDGDAAIKLETSVYQLAIDGSKSFRVKPDDGNTIKSITLNGKDIATTLKGDVIKIEGQTYAQALVVTFQSKQTGSKDTGNVNTADMTRKGILLLSVLGTGSMILFMTKKKKKR